MALTAGYSPARRGAPPPAGIFGGPIAAGEQIWRGGMLCWNAAGSLQRLQTSGGVSFAGLASKDFNNTAGAAPVTFGLEALQGTFALTVPTATFANIHAAVYATDDNTFTLTAGSNMQIGTLAGIENGQTYVKLLGA
jgi:hypothetical protein